MDWWEGGELEGENKMVGWGGGGGGLGNRDSCVINS